MRQVLPMYEFASAMRNGGFLGLIMGGPAAFPGATTPPMSRPADTTTARSMTDPDRTVRLTPRPPFVSGAFADWLRRGGQESRRTRCLPLAGGASVPPRTSPPAGPLGPVVRDRPPSKRRCRSQIGRTARALAEASPAGSPAGAESRERTLRADEGRAEAVRTPAGRGP